MYDVYNYTHINLIRVTFFLNTFFITIRITECHSCHVCIHLMYVCELLCTYSKYTLPFQLITKLGKRKE